MTHNRNKKVFACFCSVQRFNKLFY